jgi:hypothetical protein
MLIILHETITLWLYSAMILHLIRINVNWSNKIMTGFPHLFMQSLQLFVSVHYTHHLSNLFFLLHLMYSCVTLLQRGVSSWCCAYFFALYILKGYLENTEKDRIKRLIRLKPPTEFWMRNSEANVIESAIWVVWWASCELEWHVTKARQIFYSLVWCRREDFGWPLNTFINILNLTVVFML